MVGSCQWVKTENLREPSAEEVKKKMKSSAGVVVSAADEHPGVFNLGLMTLWPFLISKHQWLLRQHFFTSADDDDVLFTLFLFQCSFWSHIIDVSLKLQQKELQY